MFKLLFLNNRWFINILSTQVSDTGPVVLWEWRKWCLYLFSVTMNSIFIRLTGYKDRHKIFGWVRISAGSDQSLWSYLPLSGEKNYVSSFSHSPLIRYLSNLQVRRTGIKARMSWNLGWIRLFTLELFALECGIYFPSLISCERSLPSWAAFSLPG